MTQLRGNQQVQESIQRDLEHLKQSQAKTFKQWVNQRTLQAKYEDLERARAI